MKTENQKFKLQLIVNQNHALVAKFYEGRDDICEYQLFQLNLKAGETWDEFTSRTKKVLELMNSNSELF